jgi:hypothetical protein
MPFWLRMGSPIPIPAFKALYSTMATSFGNSTLIIQLFIISHDSISLVYSHDPCPVTMIRPDLSGVPRLVDPCGTPAPPGSLQAFTTMTK